MESKMKTEINEKRGGRRKVESKAKETKGDKKEM
jgi:hypothetical protein